MTQKEVDGSTMCKTLLARYCVVSFANLCSTYRYLIKLVSQFTLLASMKKGNKPDFHHAAPPQKGRELYDIFIGQVRKLYQEDKVKDGVFQAMMDVGIVNDGPVSTSPPSSPSIPPLSSPSSAPSSPTPSSDPPPDPPTSFIPTTPCIGVDFTCLDEVVFRKPTKSQDDLLT
jgi:D-tyrosyl-tRNA(Tyr) deacylase